MKALVTGFEPFGGDKLNASLEAVQRLPAKAGALETLTALLPTAYARALPALEAAIARAQPDIVLCVGQASGRAALCMERVAVNIQDAEIADNDGARPVEAPVVAGGPAAYLATLPVRAAVASLEQYGRWRVDALPGAPTRCAVRLQQVRRGEPLAAGPEWEVVARVRRPTDRDETTVVLRKRS